MRESRGPEVSFLESPRRERRGMRSGGPGAHGLGRRPQSKPTRASAGKRRRLSRCSQVTPATPPPGDGGFLESPGFPRPPCRPSFVPQAGKGSWRGGSEGRSGPGLAVVWRGRLGKRRHQLSVATGCACSPWRLLTLLLPGQEEGFPGFLREAADLC